MATQYESRFPGDVRISGKLRADLPAQIAAPVAESDVVTKEYADGLAVGMQTKAGVAAATTAALPDTPAYDNGASGVGATLTSTDGSGNAFPAIDGVTLSLNDRLLVKDQANAAHNGIYELTTAGADGTIHWVLTRTTDADSHAELTGGHVLVVGGTANSWHSYALVQTGTITVGTTDLNWVGFFGNLLGSVGTNLEVYESTIRIAASAAGNGLVGGGASALSVNPGLGIGISGDAVRVASNGFGGGLTGGDGTVVSIATSGVNTTKIAANAVTSAKIAASVAGSGLTGGGGSALAVNPGLGIGISGDAVRVAANGFGGGLTGGDGTIVSIASGGINSAKIAAGAVTYNELANGAVIVGKLAANAVGAGLELSSGAVRIAAAAAGGGLVGGGGSALALNPGLGIAISGDAVRIAANGVGGGLTGGDGTIVSIATDGVNTAKIAANAVTSAKIAASVAGDGLTGGGGSALAVNPGLGIGISGDAVRIAANGVGGGLTGGDGTVVSIATDGVNTAKIAANAVTSAKIAASVAGDGLTGGGGSALAVNPGLGIAISGDAVRIAANGVGGGLTGGDGTIVSIATDGVNTAKIAANAVTSAKIAASVAGSGLVGGGGSALAVGAGDAITVGGTTVGVTDLGINTAKLAANAVTSAKIAASVAGDGLTGGGGSALAVNPGLGIGISGDAVRIAANGIGGGLTGGDGTIVSIATDGVNSAKIAAGAVTRNELANSSVIVGKLAANAIGAGLELSSGAVRIATAAAGSGLTGGGGSALAVGAGDAITVGGTTVGVTDLGVNTAKLAANAVTSAKIAASVAGNGLVGGGGSALAVGAGDAITVGGTTVGVTDLGINTAKLANSSVTSAKIAASAVTRNELANGAVIVGKLAANAIGAGLELSSGAVRIAAAAAGSGLTGGGGSALAVGAGDAITVDGTTVGVTDLGINTAKLANAAVTSSKLAPNAVTYFELANSAVVVGKIAANAVGAGLELSSGAVRIATAAAGSGLTGGGGSALAVNPGLGIGISGDSVRIAANGVGGGLIGGDGNIISIATGGVNSQKIATSAVTSGKIAVDAVTYFELANSAVIVGKIAANAVGAGLELSSGAVRIAPAAAGSGLTGGGGSALAVGAGDAITVGGTTVGVTDLGINTAKLANSSVTSAKIAANAVTSAKIAANAVTRNELANSSVIVGKLAANAIGAGLELSSGAVRIATAAAGSGLTGGGGSALAVGAGDAITVGGTTVGVTDLGINTAKLAAGAVTSAKIAASAVTRNELANSAVIVGKLAANAIGAGLELSSGAVRIAAAAAGSGLTGGGGSALAVGAGDAITVDGTTVGVTDLGINTAKLAAGAVTGAKISDSSVNAAKLANGVATAPLAGGGGVPITLLYGNSSTEISSAVNVNLGGATDYHYTYTMTGGSDFKLPDASGFIGQQIWTLVTTSGVGGAVGISAQTGDTIVGAGMTSIPDESTRAMSWLATDANTWVRVAGQEPSAATATAGLGLTANGDALDVNVDDSTIEISTDTLRLKDLGITTAKIANDAVTNIKLGAGAVDAAAIASSAVTEAKIASSAVTEAKIATSAAGAGLTGGGGSALAVHFGTGGVATQSLEDDLDLSATTGDHAWSLIFNSTGAPHTLTIPNAANYSGRSIWFHIQNSSGQDVTIASGGGIIFSRNYSSIVDGEIVDLSYWSDGTNWYRMGGGYDVAFVSAGVGLEQSAGKITISTGGVSEAMLATGSVTVNKIGAGAVSSAKLASTAVTAGLIQTGTASASTMTLLESGSGQVVLGQSAIQILNDAWATEQSFYFGSSENLCGIERPASSGALEFHVWNGAATTLGMTLNTTALTVEGDVDSNGGTKNFNISHPLARLSRTHRLRHAAIEGPQADLLYRGTVTMRGLTTETVDLDAASGMTAGTFEALVGDAQVFLSNMDGWTPVRGAVRGGTLTIRSQSVTTDTISWMVVGRRIDPGIVASSSTDADGRYIPEYEVDTTPETPPS